MGAFIPINVESDVRVPDYAEELELLTREFEKNNTLQLSQFCSTRGISYQGFRSYLDKNGVSVRQLRMRVGHKSADVSLAELQSESLTDIRIKLPSQVEVTIPSVLPSQLSNLLRLL